jgi:nucleoside-diphosphate-sugar epimerase
VFGPRDTDFLGLFKCAKFCFEIYPAGPDRLVSIVYVEDLVRGILAAGQSEQSVGQTYFLANPEWVVWREFCLKVAQLMGKPALALPVPIQILKMVALAGDLVTAVTGQAPLIRSDKLDDIKQMAWICDTRKAQSELDWSPEFSVEQAIEKTAQWYRDNRWM